MNKMTLPSIDLFCTVAAMELDVQPFVGMTGARQSEEEFWATVGGRRSKFSVHDYRSMYPVPWLYDSMIYGMLGCETPVRLALALHSYLADHGMNTGTVRVLEIGAGSGAFAHALRQASVTDSIIGLDLYEEARCAATRDRPSVYTDYLVDNLCALSGSARRRIGSYDPQCVAVASATGWGNHIPVEGFENAFGLLQSGGLFVFHVKPDDPDPECVALNTWIDDKIRNEEIVDVARESIFHRRSVSGGEIFYDFVIGQRP